MEEARRLLDPLALHLQNLAIELKCSLCLQLVNRPMMLPCDHVFCNSCVPKETQFGVECPACKHQYVDQDVKPLRLLENIVSIYRSLDATFNSNLPQPVCSDAGKELVPHATIFKTNTNENSRKEPDETSQEGNSSNGQTMNGNCSYASNHHGNAVKHPAKRTAEDGALTVLELNSKCTSGVKCHTTHVKRQKKSGNWIDDNGVEINRLHLNLTSTCNLETKSENPLSGGKLSAAMDSKREPCAFCHSAEQTDGTGSLVSFGNGKQVVGYGADFSKVIYVHETCISWTPNVYFKDGIIMNLESEVARANKLKCSSCGKKGAGLGCYIQSCSRTYHVPCAYYILDCRWDCDEYLLLCPKHASHSFPSEQKHPEKRITRQLKHCTTSSKAGNNLIFCGSALSSEEMCCLVEFARAWGAIVSKFWRSDATHVIAATDSNGACTRSMKLLMAILNGKWVLTMEWVKACVEAGHLVNEEPYEVKLDNHGCSGGPKAGRQRILDKAPKLFNSLKFYFCGDFAQAVKVDLVRLVVTAGGSVVENKDELLAAAADDARATTRTLVVYNADVSYDCEFEDEDSVKFQRMAEADDIAQVTVSNAVPHIWILESIAACALLPYGL